MELSAKSTAKVERWISLWVVALLSLLAQLWMCQFFSFGERVPLSLDIDPSNLWKFAYHLPPQGSFQVYNWLGIATLPVPLNPMGLAANLPAWWFFTTYTPVVATLALLAMAAFLRELELPRPAALFGGVIYAWQGDILPFVFPGHYAYIATWPFFAIAAWGALRAQRTRHWAYALISGASCGLMVGLQPDRGSIASLLIAILYAAPILRDRSQWRMSLRQLALCAGVALLVALAAFLALFQSYIVGVKMGGESNREQTYKLVTQFSYAPEDTLTYLVPGVLGWHSSHASGPYWGRIGQWPDWPTDHQGTRSLNLAISTTGTLSAVLALMAACLLLPGRLPGPGLMSERQRLYGQVFLVSGFVALILAWGYHTPFYRVLFELPLMDKWRNPLKWLEWTNLALVVLSAYGVQHLIACLEAITPDIQATRRRVGWFAGGMVALLALALLGSYSLGDVLVANLHSAGYESGEISPILSTLHLSITVALVLTAMFCLVLYGLWKPEPLREWNLPNPLLDRIWHKMLTPEFLPLTLALSLAGLSVAQLGWVANQFIAPTSLKLLTQSNPLLEQLRSEGNRVRVSVAPQDPYLNVMLQNQFYAFNISCLDISAASRIPDDLNTFLKIFDSNHARLWFLTGVKNVVVPREFMPQLQHEAGITPNIDHADGYTLTPTTGDLPSHALVAMRDYLAKTTFVPRAEVISDEAPLLKRLADPAWNPRETVLLESPAPQSPINSSFQGNMASPGDHVALETYTPQEIKINVQSSRDGYVLINDAYDPDWEVEVNNVSMPLLRADYMLRAIPISAGSSTITMRYVAHYHVVGMKLPAEVVNDFSDGTMIAAWVVAGIVLWRRRKLEV
jgi:hypothetical protein